MANLLALDRYAPWPPVLNFARTFVERYASIDRLNAIVSSFEGCTAGEFLSGMSSYCGDYELPNTAGLLGDNTPKVFIANHPLGGADVIAAVKLMESLRAPYRILANKALAPPAMMADKVVLVDPTRRDRKRNSQAVRTVLREFGSDYQHLFVFPSGLCSRSRPGSGIITDPPWTSAFLRIALLKDAQLIPVWFSGRNRLQFYFWALALGDAAGLLIPREFFSKREKPLLCRIGVPIAAKASTYFGTAAISGLRAAVYSLAHAGACKRESPRREASRQSRPAAASLPFNVTAYTADQVDRAAVLALRRECFGRDDWSLVDDMAFHLVAQDAEGCPFGYYRGLDWDTVGSDLPRVSPLWGVYEPDRQITRKHRVWEWGRFCIRPGYRDIRIACQLWEGLARTMVRGGGAPLALGMVTLNDVNPVLAAAYFEFARRRSRCDRIQGFRPREDLVLRSRHHDFAPAHMQFAAATLGPLPAVLRIYLALGMRFGRSALWREFGNRPCVLASVQPREARVRLS